MLLSRVAEADGGVALTRLLTLADVKRHLNVYTSADDDIIPIYMAAAQAQLEGHDGTGGTLGRAITQHVLDFRTRRFPALRTMALPQPPLIDVLWVKYLDAAGIERTFDPAGYRVIRDTQQAFLYLEQTASWPSTYIAPDAVRIRIKVGPDQGESLDPVKAAMLLHIGYLYANRDQSGDATAKIEQAYASFSYKALLDPYRKHGWI